MMSNRLQRFFTGVRSLAAAVCSALALMAAAAESQSDWSAPQDAAGVRARLEDLLGSDMRIPGSPENLATEARVARRFADSGFEHGEIVFTAPTFLPGKTLLTAAGQTLKLHPLHPSLVRPGNFDSRDFEAELLYAGYGTVADLAALDGQDLSGRLLLMEFNSGRNWERFLRFGVKGILFAAAESYGPRESHDKVHSSEAAFPRFFIAAEDAALLRQAMGAQRRVQTRVQAEPSRWERRDLRNPWVLIPGADPLLRNETMLVTAALDANSVTPELATGAQSGANLLLLLDLLEDFRRQPPQRSVLLAAVNARTQNYLGDRVLAWYLLAPEADIELVRDSLADDFRYQDLIASYLEDLKLTPDTADADKDRLIEMRTLSDYSTGRQVTIKDPVVALSKRDVNEIKGQQLLLVRRESDLRQALRRLDADRGRPEADTDALERERTAIAAEAGQIETRQTELTESLEAYVNVLTLFNRAGIRTTLDELSPQEVEILRGYVNTVRERSRLDAERNRADEARSSRNAAIRAALAGSRIAFALSLELVWTHPNIGFSSGLPLGQQPWANRWGRNTTLIAAALETVQSGERANLLADTLTNVGGLPERHYLPHVSDTVPIYHRAGRTPAFSLNNLYSGWERAFSPVDRIEALDTRVVAESSNFVRTLLRAMLADPATVSELAPPPAYGGQRLWSCLIKAYKFDEFAAGVVPEIPVPRSIVILTDPAIHESGFSGGDITGVHFGLTDDRATTVFYGLHLPRLSSSVFRFDDDFTHIDHVVDAGETHRKTSSDIARAAMRILSVIPAEAEITVYDRVDTAAIGANPIYTRSYYPLSATRNSEPRKYGLSGAQSGLSTKLMPANQWGPVSFFADRGDRLQLLTLSRRLALNVTEHEPQGFGFADRDALGPDFFRQALRDMGKLNRYRYLGFRGISDELVELFLERGEASAAAADEAAETHRHLDYLRAQHDGLGAQAKAYAQITSITNDMLKAVVFFMALLLPFCFFVQKLLFKTTRIERQMGLFAILFVLCYLVFRFIHPAFAVAQAPEAMFIAFVMGGLGLFVIAILHGRFEGEMQLLFSTLTGQEQSEVGYSMVSQQAMLIGVNNMKRRRIRTLLTTATIVLVTFTMLAFTSVSRRMSPTIVQRGDFTPYTGLMYHWPGGQRMDESTLRVLNELFRDDTQRITRRWMIPPSAQDQTAVYRVEHAAGGPSALIDGVLGLDPAEHGFLGPLPLTAGRFFERADAEEIVIATDLADFLELNDADVGQATLSFMDRRFRLVGLVDGERLRNIEDINGLSILPIQQLLQPTEQSDDMSQIDEGMDDESGIFYVGTSQLLMLPTETARSLGAAPYSLSVRLSDDAPIWPTIDRMLTATSARFYVASRQAFDFGEEGSRQQPPGVYFIGAGYRTSIGGLAMLIVPLLIASTIILNTMLGAVFERKKEIAVFNAVGLNPTHIGLFFLAESFVYAIIGSVGGYLIGQVLSIVLNTFGWVEDINLNFSSLSVAYVIVFTVSIVLLSTLYPAMVATKAAVPSGKRKWSMPAHDGQTMTVAFPFIYQPNLVAGVMYYLANYLEQFDEASVGDLIVHRTAQSRGRDAQDRPTYRLSYQVALAPFDLGVTQAVDFDAAFDDQVGAYRVVMTNRRLSGQDSNWVTTNKPYLERLRKFLLHWRNLKPAEHALNVQRGIERFGEDRNGQ